MRFRPDLAGYRRWLPAWRSRPRGFLPAALRERWDEHGILFVHIPKTAGTSVCSVLYGQGIKHRPAWELALFHPLRFARARKIAVTREPIDRFLSAWDYLRAGGKNARDRAFGEKFLLGYDDINHFVEDWQDRRLRKRVSSYFHFSRQAEYVTLFGRLMVNQLVRFDRLDEMGDLLGVAIAVPEHNITGGVRTARAALSAASIAFLERHYAQDRAIWALAGRQDENLLGRALSA